MIHRRPIAPISIRVLHALLGVVLCGCSGGASSGLPSTTITTPPSTATVFYVNCSMAVDGNGTQASPWNNLSDVNAHTFVAGNSLLFARGTTCNGSLQPQGSGSSSAPITIDAYGTGAQPIINGGSTSMEAVYLNNQQYWNIADLEVAGGVNYGVYITGNIDNQQLNGITLTNLNVHGATGISTKRGDSGEVVLSPTGIGQTLNNILIDGVTAHDSKVSEGIAVHAGGAWTGPSTQTLGSNVTVKNSTAFNVYGDGILITELTNGLVENSVVHDTGECPSCGSTPSGLWEWFCHKCIIQNNESYANQTWNGDGGDFDIDYYNTDNIVQYNYGHDSAGYCVANFGAENTADSNNIIRYNVCSNNMRKASNPSQGDIFLSSWNGGSLNGIQIYNNTFYWNPATPQALLSTIRATFTGSSPDLFENNIIYSTVPNMISTSSPLMLDANIYYFVSGTPSWSWNGASYTSLASYQAASAQDSHSTIADPMLNSPASGTVGRPTSAFTLQTGSPAIGTGMDVCQGATNCSMGTQDFFGNALPGNGIGLNIGAYQ